MRAFLRFSGRGSEKRPSGPDYKHHARPSPAPGGPKQTGKAAGFDGGAKLHLNARCALDAKGCKIALVNVGMFEYNSKAL